MLRLTWIAAAALAAGCVAPHQGPSAAGAIRDPGRIPQMYIDAYRNGDAQAIASLFAADATFIPLLPMARFAGPEPVRAYYQRAIANSRSRNITPSNELVQDYGDVIVRTSDIVIDQETLDGRKLATPARVTFVYRRDRDGWRIVHHHQSVRPAPPPAATQPVAPAVSVPVSR